MTTDCHKSKLGIKQTKRHVTTTLETSLPMLVEKWQIKENGGKHVGKSDSARVNKSCVPLRTEHE